ncbi:unnamed protein product [Rotaria sp. Silwood2]|nr:unnamed protein product [Rotaria sp. Silwood2]CAF2798941.1 unnamed protein product [Rotaria sp. Silwood2]CAF4244529.1 unnamed protein product [Rotaria sp. Silwood2]
MAYSIIDGLRRTLLFPVESYNVSKSDDVLIKFHCAKGLPKKDIIGSCDPYFISQIDDGRIQFISSCIPNTLTPVWNENWLVRNVPRQAKLSVKLFDKDDDTINDDYIGNFELVLLPTIRRSIEIKTNWSKVQGIFVLSIDRFPSSPETRILRPYTFDGPVRYSRHNSLVLGQLVKVNDERLYSTWEIHLKRIDYFFNPNKKQKWNSSYKAAQSIFEGPMSLGIQLLIKQAHHILYAKHTTNQFGVLNSSDDLWKLLSDETKSKIKPCVYTYIIDDSTWKFSETGASFFVDFASKHALHANCSETVRYAGEFHPRPICGWNRFNSSDPLDFYQWELVIDNGSGTYAPNRSLLGKLNNLLSFNFPRLKVVTYHFEDPQLKSSIEACRSFAKSYTIKPMRTVEQLVSAQFKPFTPN